LLGEFVLVIGPGNNSLRRLQDGDEIATVQEPITMDAILNDLGHVANRVKSVTDSLANTLGSEQGEEDIRRTLQNVAQVTEQLNEAVRENRQSIRQIVGSMAGISSRSERQIDDILTNVRVVTGEFRALVEQDDGNVQGSLGTVRNTLEHLNKASIDLHGALRNINSVTGRVERGEGTFGRLTKDETLIDEVEGVVAAGSDFVGGISRLQTVIGLRGDFNFQANTMKSFVELRLQPREDKYYLSSRSAWTRTIPTVRTTIVRFAR
jgi:phospholipid/cholesterol/gamma-HCH transport system substrate-binding protein